MSEEAEGQDTGAEAVAGGIAGVDPAAVALALGGASRDTADAFLNDQRAFIADQRHYVRERYKQLVEQVEETWLRIWALRVVILLRVATFCVGVAVAAAIGLMVWDAAHSNGLIIEPFAVPEDMAAKGLTGQVIASQMLDKIYAMDSVPVFNRSAKSYANNWGSDIKVQIPETGVSIGEFRQFFRDWLGHDTHISGEIYHTDTGLVITARTSGESGASFAGPQTDLDPMIQKAAEYIYGSTQPARFAGLLINRGRIAEGSAIFNRLTVDPSRLERAWAWTGLSVIPRREFDYAGALWYLRRATSVYPDFSPAYHLSAWFERLLSHPEAALKKYREAKALFGQSAVSQFDPRRVPKMRVDTDLYIAFLLGDLAQAVTLGRAGEDIADAQGSEVTLDTFRNATAISLGLQHDGMHARAFFSQMPEPGVGSPNPNPGRPGTALLMRDMARVRMDSALEDWPAVVAAESAAEKRAFVVCPDCDMTKVIRVELRPWLALAKARTGDIAGGEALIATTPGDCYDCVRIRGKIAEEAKQPGRADYWFARAVHDNPSIPFAYADWAEALMERGDYDGAIAKLKIANRRGPKFADPLEMWGETLTLQKHPDQALAKFEEAEKYAPNWGRLHLKWGEALVYAGKKDEARAQYEKASMLDLIRPTRLNLQE